MAAFLKGEGYSSRHSAIELMARLRAAAVGRMDRLEERAKKELVLALTRILMPLIVLIEILTTRIETKLHRSTMECC